MLSFWHRNWSRVPRLGSAGLTKWGSNSRLRGSPETGQRLSLGAQSQLKPECFPLPGSHLASQSSLRPSVFCLHGNAPARQSSWSRRGPCNGASQYIWNTSYPAGWLRACSPSWVQLSATEVMYAAGQKSGCLFLPLRTTHAHYPNLLLVSPLFSLKRLKTDLRIALI